MTVLNFLYTPLTRHIFKSHLICLPRYQYLTLFKDLDLKWQLPFNWKEILRALHGEVANLSQVWNQWKIRNINFLRVDRKENFQKLSCTKQATSLIISKIICNHRLQSDQLEVSIILSGYKKHSQGITEPVQKIGRFYMGIHFLRIVSLIKHKTWLKTTLLLLTPVW